jgi:CHAT domain-containing protein
MGRLIQLHENIMNKNPLSFTLSHVQSELQRQKELLKELPVVEDRVKTTAQEVQETVKKYEQFEEDIFDKEVEDTT